MQHLGVNMQKYFDEKDQVVAVERHPRKKEEYRFHQVGRST
jgi:hypothetical protein